MRFAVARKDGQPTKRAQADGFPKIASESIEAGRNTGVTDAERGVQDFAGARKVARGDSCERMQRRDEWYFAPLARDGLIERAAPVRLVAFQPA